MSLDDAAAKIDALLEPNRGPSVPPHTPRERSAPKGWEPGIQYVGEERIITTVQVPSGQPLPEAEWGPLLETMQGPLPDGWVLELMQASYDPVAWTRAVATDDDGNKTPAVTRPAWRYKFKARYDPQVGRRIDVDALIAQVRDHTPARRMPLFKTVNPAYVSACGDLQLGKVDGDGAAGTVDRFMTSIDAATGRLEHLRQTHDVDTVYLPWLGDCIEGFNSQGGRLGWRVGLTLTEQIRLLRQLMLAQIKAFAPLAARVVVPVVPGNHDEAVRTGDKMSTRYDDSFALDAASAVGDALVENPAAYGHVSIVVPGRDELTLTLDMAGTTVGMAHGHQFGNDVEKWWAGQAHGMQPIGDATVLLGAHRHHLRVIQSGAKTFIQTPAFESESTWWRHRTGQVSPPGSVSMLVGGGGWSDFAVL